MSTQEGLTAMHVAATEGHEIIIKELVEEYDADIHCLTEEGLTPLHLAALSGHADCVRLLIDYGAQIDALDMVRQGIPHHFLRVGADHF
jgi:ankyrin repeat protein